MSKNQFTTYRRQNVAGAIRCAKCGQTRQVAAGTMLAHETNGPTGPCCMTPRQTKMAAAIKNAPPSALAMERKLRPGEKLTGPTPAEIMEARR